MGRHDLTNILTMLTILYIFVNPYIFLKILTILTIFTIFVIIVDNFDNGGYILQLRAIFTIVDN